MAERGMDAMKGEIHSQYDFDRITAKINPL